MFLDASAIVAVLGSEEDAELMLDKIGAARGGLFYSPISAYEAILSLARKSAGPEQDGRPIPRRLIEQSEELVLRFFQETGASEISITKEMRLLAVAASKAYGRSVGHPAKLNMGDCFAYACARSLNVPLLFKGNDFPHTDIAAA